MLISTGIFAQASGDYRSLTSGNWKDFNSWERYNGAAWVPAVAGQTPGAAAGIGNKMNGRMKDSRGIMDIEL